MKRKIAKACFGVTVLGLFSVLTVANFSAYAVLRGINLR